MTIQLTTLACLAFLMTKGCFFLNFQKLESDSRLNCVLVFKETCGSDWNYDLEGPSEWLNIGYPLCGGSQQSPIDVVTSSTRYDSSLKPFTMTGYDQPLNFNMYWNGHTGKL